MKELSHATRCYHERMCETVISRMSTWYWCYLYATVRRLHALLLPVCQSSISLYANWLTRI